MTEKKTVPTGTWVQVEKTILAPGERAPQLPEETKRVPLVELIKGHLVTEAVMGGPALVRTVTGREEEGILRVVNPAFSHSFGGFVPELLTLQTQWQNQYREAQHDE